MARSDSDKHAAILTAVWRVIARDGIAGVSIRSVAAAAGVSVGLVQHYVGSKGNLIRESAAAMIQGSAQWFDAESTTPREDLRRAVAHTIPQSGGSRLGLVVWHAFIAASVSDPELAVLLREAKRGQEAEAARLIAGLAPEVDAVAAARRLLAIGDGLAARVITDDLTVAEAIDAVDDAILNLELDSPRRGE